MDEGKLRGTVLVLDTGGPKVTRGVGPGQEQHGSAEVRGLAPWPLPDSACARARVLCACVRVRARVRVCGHLCEELFRWLSTFHSHRVRGLAG